MKMRGEAKEMRIRRLQGLMRKAILYKVENLSDSELPRDILSLLRSRAKDYLQQGLMPKKMSATLDSHTKAVNAVRWSPSHGYMEAYTCPCVKCHPFDPVFIAQSNGDYTASFSLSPPFKLDKYKRYGNHGVSGFPIKCNFSLDAKQIISGSADGSIYFYDYKSSLLMQKLKAFEHACIDIAVHLTLPNVITSCSWNGNISVIQ